MGIWGKCMHLEVHPASRFEESNLLKRRYKKDQLAKMDESLLLSDNNSNASSSCNGTTNIIISDNDSL